MQKRSIQIIIYLLVVIAIGCLVLYSVLNKNIFNNSTSTINNSNVNKISIDGLMHNIQILFDDKCNIDGAVIDPSGNTEAISWLNEQGLIEIIGGSTMLYFDYGDVSQPVHDESIVKSFSNCAEKFREYFINSGFVKNQKNSIANYMRVGMENSNIKCVIEDDSRWPTLSVSCGDIKNADTSPEYQQLYKDIIGTVWGEAVVAKIVGDWALGGIYQTNGGAGGQVLFKKENGKWIESAISQSDWSCQPFFNAGVSPDTYSMLMAPETDVPCVDEDYKQYNDFYQNKIK